MRGQSGSIVYVIDAKSGEYLRFGQLIGECVPYSKLIKTTVYRAVVLRQALDEFHVTHKYSVRALRPLGQDDNKVDDVRAVIDQLETDNQRRHSVEDEDLNISFSSSHSTRPPSSLLSLPSKQEGRNCSQLDSGVAEPCSVRNLTEQNE